MSEKSSNLHKEGAGKPPSTDPAEPAGRSKTAGIDRIPMRKEGPVRATDSDTFTATLRCHDPNGEVYTVTVGREAVPGSSYSDDAILTAVEAWADGVPALA